MIEADIRYQIDRSLEAKGWFLDAHDHGRNVFFEESVKVRLPRQSVQNLGHKRPDYTLFDGVIPLAVIEAKKPAVANLDNALSQARDYADRIGVKIVFACNGTTLKSQYLDNDKPLLLNGVEVNEFLPLELLKRFQSEGTNEIFTVSKKVIRSREQLIQLFSELNNDLRAAGLRAGIERFSEFANILFLKLLSEKGDDGIWRQLLQQPEKDLLLYLNEVAMKRLSEVYGGEVIAKSSIKPEHAGTMRKIIHKLNPLHLTGIDEDIKGVAFEHFIQKTTDTQNDLGEYFTPRHIIRFMVRLLNPKYGENIYDPFCGTGGFLTESFKHISQQCRLSKEVFDTLHNQTVFGGEITTTARIAKMNMILFGDGHSGVTQQDSLQADTNGKYDNVLSNIPFSQNVSQEILDRVEGHPKDADEGCVIKCFNSLKLGGSMAIVVPDGLLVNRKHTELLRFLFSNSRVRLLARLPRGCFAPYTDAKTGIIYLTDKGTQRTDWFYQAAIRNDGFDSKRNPVNGINDLEKTLFFYQDSDEPEENMPINFDISVISVKNLESRQSFHLYERWEVADDKDYIRLEDAAVLQNGKSITKADTVPGDIPVIAGGRGTVPYTHGDYNHLGGVFTISKSGAYAGYVWWHEDPIWASDSIVVKSKDESKFLTRYLFMCMALKQQEIYNRQQGTGQPHIYISHIKDFPIPILSIEKQISLFEPFEETWIKLKALERKLAEHTDRIKEFIQLQYK